MTSKTNPFAEKVWKVMFSKPQKCEKKIQDKTYFEKEHLENSEYESKSRFKKADMYSKFSRCSSS